MEHLDNKYTTPVTYSFFGKRLAGVLQIEGSLIPYIRMVTETQQALLICEHNCKKLTQDNINIIFLFIYFDQVILFMSALHFKRKTHKWENNSEKAGVQTQVDCFKYLNGFIPMFQTPIFQHPYYVLTPICSNTLIMSWHLYVPTPRPNVMALLTVSTESALTEAGNSPLTASVFFTG